eukprot:scaffold108416_cov29-Prasinocladus_malaysianus.AAC.1
MQSYSRKLLACQQASAAAWHALLWMFTQQKIQMLHYHSTKAKSVTSRIGPSWHHHNRYSCVSLLLVGYARRS